MNMECQLDFRHAAIWCEACWAAEQQSRQTNALISIADRLEQLVPGGDTGESITYSTPAPPLRTHSAPPRRSPEPPPPGPKKPYDPQDWKE